MTLWSFPAILTASLLLLAGAWVWIEEWRDSDKRAERRCDKWAADWSKPLRVKGGR